MDVIFSGIQPSGSLTLGNYLGALKNFIPFQETAECYYCVVNQHAITVPQNPALLHERTRNLAALYIAAGMDPRRSDICPVGSTGACHAWMDDDLQCVCGRNGTHDAV